MKQIALQIISSVLIGIGIFAFLVQPVVGIGTKDGFVYVLTPNTALLFIVIGLLLRIERAINWYRDKE